MSRSLSRSGLVLVAAALAASCKFNEITIPETTPAVVVHAVLNPANLTQVVLVERTLTGVVPIADSVFNPADPIRSDGGIPVNGARVVLTDTAGRSTAGLEDVVENGTRGTGVYRINLNTPLRTGARYSLSITTPQGEIVTGETRVPRSPVQVGVLSRQFNRDHDTLNVQWAPTGETRTYAIRIESPFGPYFLFSDSTRFRLVGDARNLFANNLEHLFIPGYRQDVLVAGVDSNFYDYYRTNNDPFTGAGIISRLKGGIGLFGAITPITSGTLAVVADQTEPIEGRFRASPTTTDPQRVLQLNLYVESKSTRPDVPDALSGRFTNGGPNGISNGIIGEMTGLRVTLVMVSNQLAHDTIDVFNGDLSSDGTTLVGTFRSQGAVHYTYIKQ